MSEKGGGRGTATRARIPVEESSGNVFADLDLPQPEAEHLKARLTLEIYRLIKTRGLTQAQAGEGIVRCGVRRNARPREKCHVLGGPPQAPPNHVSRQRADLPRRVEGRPPRAVIRRPPQLGQNPRPLQENGTRCSRAQSSH